VAYCHCDSYLRRHGLQVSMHVWMLVMLAVLLNVKCTS